MKLFLGLGVIAAMAACNSGNESTSETTEKADAKKEPTAEVVTHSVDTSQSMVMWKGVMLGVKDHTGTLAFSEAKIKTQDGEVVGGSFVVDMQSMVATDDNYQPEEGKTKEKLIGHLMSDDFFAVANHPTSKFVIENVEGNTATGKLTVRGKTNEATVENFEFNQETGMVTGTMTFDRQKYNVSFSTGAADFVISDDIVVDVKMKVQG